MKAATLNEKDEKEQDKKITCSICEGEMYRLLGSSNSIYICQNCGCSIEGEEIKYEFKNIDSENNKDLDKINIGQKCLNKLFNPEFMKKYTKYNNFTDFMVASELIPKKISSITYDIFKNISLRKLDNYINSSTVFKSWDEMFDCATGKYLRIQF